MGCNQSSGENHDNLKLDQDLQHELSIGQKYDRSANRPQSNLFQVQQATEEQFMATKPWIGALKQPTNKPNNDPSPPSKQLTLQFVNGFKVEDSRQNIYWTKANTIVYPAAALGVVMDTTTLKQKFMGAGNTKTANGHTDDIISLGIDSERKLVVTGSVGAQPLILLWDANTLEIKSRTKLARNTRAVSTIRFSKDGHLVFCTDKHNDSNVYCFSSPALELRGTNKCGGDPVIDSETGNDNTFACATKSGVWFFQQTQAGLSQNRGIFGENPRNAMSAITFSSKGNQFLSGSIEGQIYYWQNKTCTKSRKIHSGAVMALQAIDDKVYSSGANDKLLKVTNLNGQTIKQYSLPSYAKSIDVLNNKIVVGTKCGRIITIEDQQTQKVIMHGHYTGQTWGCAVGSDGYVYTTGDDNNILGFNTKTMKVEKQGIINQNPGKKYKIGGASTLSLLPPNQQSRAIALNKAGHVAIASNDGDLSIRTTKDLNSQIFKARQSNQWIQVIRYSPDEKRLAVGSHDNNIYIYNVNGNTYQKFGVLKGHNSFITGLDWSTDGNTMQSVCGAYELLFWDVNKLSQVTEGGTKFRDQKWATLTVKIGWSIQGIFPAECMGTHVNGVDRTKDSKIIVTADDWGFVNLYKNPCLKGNRANSFRGHSSHVVKAILDQKDEFIYSVGGYDKTLMVWKLG